MNFIFKINLLIVKNDIFPDEMGKNNITKLQYMKLTKP